MISELNEADSDLLLMNVIIDITREMEILMLMPS